MIHFTVFRAERGKHELRELMLAAKDMTPVWPLFGDYLSRQINRQFLTQGAQFKTPWKPLTPSYAFSKRKRAGDPRILILTGVLRKSLTSRPMNIEIYGKQSAMYGTTERTAVWHHYGTHHNGRKINPARPVYKETPNHSRRLKQLIVAHLKESHRA